MCVQAPDDYIGREDEAAQQLSTWVHVEPKHDAENIAQKSSHAADAGLEGSEAGAAGHDHNRRESQEQPQYNLHRLEHGIEAIIQAQLSRFERSLTSICDAALARLDRDLCSIVRISELHKGPVTDSTNLPGVDRIT